MAPLLKRIIQFNNLAQAWEEIAVDPVMPGVDGVTVEDFARNWEANLRDLQQAVRSSYYRPAPLLKFSIPKSDGSPRWLGNLTLRDKLLQRATLRLLSPIYEAVFLDCSFGYRPGRSVKLVVERILTARDFGYTWVLDADIDDFFNSLNHTLLVRFLREQLDDERLLVLIQQWLKIGRLDPKRAVGTPLGAIISPLLSNIYLHYLDLVMTDNLPPIGLNGAEKVAHKLPRWTYLRYADDFAVLCRTEADAHLALAVVEETVQTLLLGLEPTKTTLTTFEQGFDYLGCYFKGADLYFTYKNQWIKVDTAGEWRLFCQHGPQGYR